jgi:hypothetical protein
MFLKNIAGKQEGRKYRYRDKSAPQKERATKERAT